jgi:hypothetical protein
MGRVAEVAVRWVALTAGYVTLLGAFTGPPHLEHKVTHGSGPWS